jgi:hypothetical protein
MPCAECTQRERQCTYQRLGEQPRLPPLIDKFPLTSTSQDLLETPDVESSGTNDEVPKVSEASWDLGPATLYPWNKEVLARCRFGD